LFIFCSRKGEKRSFLDRKRKEHKRRKHKMDLIEFKDFNPEEPIYSVWYGCSECDTCKESLKILAQSYQKAGGKDREVRLNCVRLDKKPLEEASKKCPGKYIKLVFPEGERDVEIANEKENLWLTLVRITCALFHHNDDIYYAEQLKNSNSPALNKFFGALKSESELVFKN